MREAALTFAAGFLLFAAGAAPSVTFGDAGEFAACAATLSLPHAPDYPFYTLAARAFGDLVPLGNWAYRTNLFSALCAALALAVLGDALRRLGLSRAARGAGLAALALTPLWRYSAGVTEVFALHWLLCACVLWLLARFEENACAPRAAAALGLVFGLGAAAHQTLALAAPAVLAQAWSRRPSARAAGRAAATLLAFAALGFAIFAFLPLRGVKSPPLDWGHPVDLKRFVGVVLRRDYGSLSLTVEGRGGGDGASRLPAQLSRWAGATAAQAGWPLLALAVLGLSGALPRGPRLAAAVWVFCAGPLFLFLGDPPFDAQTSGALERFYGASWLGAVVLAAAGVDALGRRWRLAGAAAAAALALGPLRPGAWMSGWERGDLAAHDYGRAVQNSLPRGAALFMDGGDDTFYTQAFFAYAQRRREDLELHDRGGVVFKSAYGDFRAVPRALKEPIRQAVERPLAQSGRLFYSTLNPSLLPGTTLEPWGLLRRPSRSAAPDLWAAYPWRFDERLLRARYRDRALAAFYPAQRALARGARGDYASARGDLELALAWAPDALWVPSTVAYEAGVLGYEATQARRWADAEALYGVWAKAAPGMGEPRLNLGVVAERTGRTAAAEARYRQAIALEPDSSRARYSLGALLWAQKRWAESAEQLEAAHRLSPDEPSYARFAALARSRAAR